MSSLSTATCSTQRALANTVILRVFDQSEFSFCELLMILFIYYTT